MPVPTTLASLSTTAASNSPGGGENPFPDLDDHIRAGYAFDAQNRDAIAAKLDASAVSAYMLTVLNDADAATARATLGAVGLTGNETVAGTKTFSSSPIAPTPTTGDNTTKIATTAFVKTTADAAVADRSRVSLTASKATTSGTEVDFSPVDGTGLPTWAKRITGMLHGVSTNGSSAVTVQVGSGSFDVTGYEGAAGYTGTASAAGLMANGFATETASGPGVTRRGHFVLTHMGGNVWVFSSTQGRSDSAYIHVAGGSKALSGVLDRIRITATNGTDVFDAGSVALLIEG